MARITTGFNVASTALDVVANIGLTGKHAIVTGGASGIGIETARALAKAGAEVTLAVRNSAAGTKVAADITASTGRAPVQVMPLELTDRASIAAFVAAWQGPLHILVNNAGVMALPEQHTAEGWEMQFATNHLGHFMLATGLHQALAAAKGARIVSVSSSAHLRSPVVFDDIHFAFRPYDPIMAYAQSKTANVLFAVGATSHWRDDGITANALMPGAIETGLQRHIDPQWLAEARARLTMQFKSVGQGAATSVVVATSPLLEGIGGRYFEDCNEAEPVMRGHGTPTGVAPYALDPDNAERLWVESERLVGL